MGAFYTPNGGYPHDKETEKDAEAHYRCGGAHGADAVDGPLNHQLAQVEAGLLESGHGGVAAGAADKKGVQPGVLPGDGQEGTALFDIQGAQQGAQRQRSSQTPPGNGPPRQKQAESKPQTGCSQIQQGPQIHQLGT